MKTDLQHAAQEHDANRRAKSIYRWVLIGFLVIAAFLLILEHRVHLLGILPYLILLACPLMHFFMHRSHGGGHKHGSNGEST